jgi:hypothetical protein
MASFLGWYGPLSGPAGGSAGQLLQVVQFLLAHVAQPLPVPLTRCVSPLLPRLTAAKRERARDVASLPQLAHATGASAARMGRSFWNLVPQSRHTYS